MEILARLKGSQRVVEEGKVAAEGREGQVISFQLDSYHGVC